LLATVPLLVYWIYPPEVTAGAEVPGWAAKELKKMGPLSNKEITLGVLVVLALLLWIFGGNIMEATAAAIAVISLMLILGVVTWDDITANKAAWNTLAWFATPPNGSAVLHGPHWPKVQ
jgi:L-tartrate/succinate antiporter